MSEVNKAFNSSLSSTPKLVPRVEQVLPSALSEEQQRIKRRQAFAQELRSLGLDDDEIKEALTFQLY
ncbi:hypothetical protein [Shewanella sp.]|uniref:hypothetical protein n=1 Tax=Shewanella sp. TaxID=50422 RepID=UPI003D108E89